MKKEGYNFEFIVNTKHIQFDKHLKMKHVSCNFKSNMQQMLILPLKNIQHNLSNLLILFA